MVWSKRVDSADYLLSIDTSLSRSPIAEAALQLATSQLNH
jgi:hypothetical protein